MRIIGVFFIACALAAMVPLRPIPPTAHSGDQISYPFPDQYEGKKLTPVAMTGREKRFYRSFPGRMVKMTDGKRQVTYKWIARPTRKLHPASDCFRGMGYSIHPGAILVDDGGQRWGTFRAVKGHRQILVKEKISDLSNHQWTDVSGWYWSALLGRSPGPWLAITVSELILEP
jgi:hypothetical protein